MSCRVCMMKGGNVISNVIKGTFGRIRHRACCCAIFDCGCTRTLQRYHCIPVRVGRQLISVWRVVVIVEQLMLVMYLLVGLCPIHACQRLTDYDDTYIGMCCTGKIPFETMKSIVQSVPIDEHGVLLYIPSHFRRSTHANLAKRLHVFSSNCVDDGQELHSQVVGQ
jgi:hypothetical protein